MKILVLMPDNKVRRQFLTCDNTKELEQLGEVVWNSLSRQLTAEELRELLPGFDAVITGWGCPRIGKEVLGSEKHPSLIMHTGGTVAPYVDDITFQRGIRVVSANELYAKSVAEGTLAYILTTLRQIPYWDREMRCGRWRGEEFTNYSLYGKKVGLIGFGAVARHLVPLLKPFETQITVFADHVTPEECVRFGIGKASLETIFAESDIISLHNSLTDETWHMVDQRLLATIREGVVLVNTARGGIIDQQALVEELSKGRFTALLDVFEAEPLEPDSPLRRMDHVILVPHMAGPTSDQYERIGKEMICELAAYQSGKPLRYEIPPVAVQYMTAKG